MWPDLLLRTHLTTMWKVKMRAWDSVRRLWQPAQVRATENYTKEVALGKTWSEEVYKKVDLMRVGD